MNGWAPNEPADLGLDSQACRILDEEVALHKCEIIRHRVEQDSWSMDFQAKYDAYSYRAFPLQTITDEPRYW